MRVLGLAAVVLAFGAPAATAAEVTSVQAPKRVKAGASVKIDVAVKDVRSCRLTAGKASATAAATGADRVTFTFTVSRTVKPKRYRLTLRCTGAATRRIALTVTKGKGKRGTSSKLVKGKIKTATRRAVLPLLPVPPSPEATPAPAPPPAPVENALRAVYAIAADQAEEPGYVAGIVATIDAANAWFATQTIDGETPRWLRDFSGTPQVDVVKLPRTAADYGSPGGFARLHAELEAAAQLPTPSQRRVVWSRTTHPDGACGSTEAGVAWLPELACGIRPVAPTSWPLDGTYLLAHELTHLFGAAADCAPNADGTGHVTDDPRDILFAGARDFANLQLDVGRNDYYGTGSGVCTDIATSPLWMPRES